MKNKIVSIVAALLVVGLYFVYKNTKTKDVNVVVTEEEIEKESPEDGSDVLVEETEMKAVGDYSGEGTATRSFGGGVFVHGVRAKINDPSEGKFYEGWLVKKEPSLDFFSTGKLKKEGEEYVLFYSNEEDGSEYKEVVVTEETEELGLDNNPETHVLEGSF